MQQPAAPRSLLREMGVDLRRAGGSYARGGAIVTLKKFKSLITDRRVYDCIENTYKPELNGQERMIVKAQSNGWFWVITNSETGERYWSDMPTKDEILESSTNGFGGVIVKLRTARAAPSLQHTLTLKFYMESGEEFSL
jgi:hypothetical protein